MVVDDIHKDDVSTRLSAQSTRLIPSVHSSSTNQPPAPSAHQHEVHTCSRRSLRRWCGRSPCRRPRGQHRGSQPGRHQLRPELQWKPWLLHLQPGCWHLLHVLDARCERRLCRRSRLVYGFCSVSHLTSPFPVRTSSNLLQCNHLLFLVQRQRWIVPVCLRLGKSCMVVSRSLLDQQVNDSRLAQFSPDGVLHRRELRQLQPLQWRHWPRLRHV